MSARPPPEAAVHLTLRWRHDVLAVRRVGAEGVPVGALAPIPCAPALSGFVFARVAGGVATAFAPAGGAATLWKEDGGVEIVEGPAEIRIGAGDVAELALGDFVLAASAGAPEAFPRARRRAAAVWGVALAALAHAVALGLAAEDARASSAEDREEAQVEALRGLLASAEQRARGEEARPIEDATGRGEGREENHKRGDGRAGGGAKAEGEEGKMGDALGRPGDQRRWAVPEERPRDASPEAARAQALADATAFGMIGLLAQGSAGPSAPFADAWAHGVDPIAARGEMWARVAGESGGVGGLGLSGIGEGGGGDGLGIGLGRIGTLGHTDGPEGPGLGGAGSPGSGGSTGWSGDRGLLGGMHQVRGPYCRCGMGVNVSGRLPPEIIQRIVRQNFGRFRACYEAGLARSPTLAGTVSTRFVIGRDGNVANVGDGGSSMPDAAVTSCVLRAFYGVSFPQPEGGIVTVTYPIVFSPG